MTEDRAKTLLAVTTLTSGVLFAVLVGLVVSDWSDSAEPAPAAPAAAEMPTTTTAPAPTAKPAPVGAPQPTAEPASAVLDPCSDEVALTDDALEAATKMLQRYTGENVKRIDTSRQPLEREAIDGGLGCRLEVIAEVVGVFVVSPWTADLVVCVGPGGSQVAAALAERGPMPAELYENCRLRLPQPASR